MQVKKYSLFLFTALIIVTGCEDQVLNKSPRDSFATDDVWNDIGLIKQFVNNMYAGLETWHAPNTPYVMYANYTEDAMLAEELDQTYSINSGNISPDVTGALDTWERNYEYIRKANIFLSKIDDVDTGNDQDIKNLKGEVKYIRAKMYFDLIKNYGGVPLITKVFSLDDEFQVSGRNSYEELVDWIVSELDEAEDLVPLKRPNDEWGRVNKNVCLGTKAEVLLHANSKLHDPSTEPSGPLFDYNKNTWQEAADAAKAVIDDPRYNLQQVNSAQEYHNLLIRPNPEVIIFPQLFSAEFPTGTPINTVNGLPQSGAWMETGASQGLVDEFEMKNGKRIYESGSGYDDSPGSIYDNRDLRFYANISYNGSMWKDETFNVVYPDGYNVNTQFSTTGYLVRKFRDESLSINEETPVWPRLRLATMYLIYAETQFELGNEDEARKYINKVRNRVNMPDINSSGNELFKDIQHERRIELSFEGGYHFFDVRRWMIAPETGNKPIKGIEWRKIDEDGGTDPDNLTYTIQVFQERVFDKKFYYLPIPQTEMDRTNSLEQNPGY